MRLQQGPGHIAFGRRLNFGITKQGAHEAAGADLQRPLVLAAAVGGNRQAVGHDEEALLHATEAEAAKTAAGAGERRSRGVPSGRAAGILHVGG